MAHVSSSALCVLPDGVAREDRAREKLAIVLLVEPRAFEIEIVCGRALLGADLVLDRLSPSGLFRFGLEFVADLAKNATLVADG
jgi:hypothetical protein